MTKKLAVLSGKGGSGKTSLCLSFASLLSTCGIKTLLIDCDLSTNGAAYFFENRLNSDKNIYSILGLINEPFSLDEQQKSVVSIQESFDFVPSVSAIDGSIAAYTDGFLFSYSSLEDLIKNYEVVIFDCQAGYSDILKEILPNVDETLFVMEADAISSASIRSLHLKIGSLLNRQSFQVFNKMTKEEYDIYNKISGGTLFMNIESVLFDWRIRKAFALSQIPTIDAVGYGFYEQIFNICKVLFPEEENMERMSYFSKKILMKKIQEEKSNLIEKLEMAKNTSRLKRTKMLPQLTMFYLVSVFSIILWVFLRKDGHLLNLFDYKIDLLVFVAFASSLLAAMTSIYVKKLLDSKDSIFTLKKQLSDIEKKEQMYM